MQGSGRHRRRAISLATCVLWLLAVEILPALHLASHDHDHTHSADGRILALERHWYAHEHGLEHRHEHISQDRAKPSSKRRTQNQLAIDESVAQHTASGLSHHATALLSPSPPHGPVEVRPHTWGVDAEIDDALATTTFAQPKARGPPAITIS